jgi:hypothetical protein
MLTTFNDIYLAVMTAPSYNREWIIYWMCFGCVKETERWTKHKEERRDKCKNRKKIWLSKN